MQRWLAMISGLRRLTAAREQPNSRLQPNGYLASALLALLPDLALTDVIALPGSDAAEGGRQVTTLPQLTQAALAIEGALREGTVVAHALEPIERAVNMLCVLHTLDSTPEASLRLQLDDPELHRSFRTLRIAMTNKQPDVIIVGDDSSGPFTVSLPGTSYSIVRLAIRYARNQRYPVLLLRTPTQSAYDRRPQQRSNWLQKALPSYDVDLYTYSHWKKGTVRTRLIPAPHSIEGQQLHITLSAGPGGSLLETAVYDERDCCLVRCIHPVEHPLERA